MLVQTAYIARIRYPGLATEGRYELRTAPYSGADQECLSLTVSSVPPADVGVQREPGGLVHRLVVGSSHESLDIRMDGRVLTRVPALSPGTTDGGASWSFYDRVDVQRECAALLAPTTLVPLGPDAERIAEAARRQNGRTPLAFVTTLVRILHNLLDRSRNGLEGGTEIAPFLADEAGVPQYFTHAAIAACRAAGIPCRYVGGYRAIQSSEATGQAATSRGPQALNAWLECLVPDGDGSGRWAAFDVVRGVQVDERYAPAHRGRDYHDVRPLSLTYRGPAAVRVETEAWAEEIAE